MTAKGTPPYGTIRPEIIADRYKVEREIGRGGMATVYLCKDMKDGGMVAVKVLRPELGSAVVVERFLREIEFASELDHPQIPKVLDSGLVGELPYYVMTFIDGESLRAKLDREKQLPLDEAIRIIKEVIRPCAFAHARGIVHRDIKPPNILLAKDQIYVLDFGVARAIMASADESLTSTGVAVGTPAYMSPEQALADHNVDARSDIYSLGCVAYEMIAGIPPFVGATPQSVMARRFIAPPPPLHELRDLIPPEIEYAVMRSLTKSPADRWQKIEDFGQALSADPTSPSIRTQAIVLEKKKKWYGWAVLGAAVIALAAAAGSWAYSTRDNVGRGRTALDSWDFATAEKAFRSELKDRPNSPEAQLWLAQLMMIRKSPNDEWQPLALRAVDRKSELGQFDQLRAEALASFAVSEDADPCGALEKLRVTREPLHPSDFTSSLAYADCIVADRTVIRDPASPSGFRFRRSYRRAAGIYEGLLTRNAGNSNAFRALMPRLEQVFPTNKNTLRIGVEQGDIETRFVAWPELDADTVAYVPLRLAGAGIALALRPASVERVLARNLSTLERLSGLWVRNAPLDPEAHETLSRMLEASGRLYGSENSALSQAALARTVSASGDPDEDKARRIRLATTQVRLLLKIGRFNDAAVLSDSVIRAVQAESPDTLADDDVDMAAGLAALTGRLGQVMQLEQRNAGEYPVRLASGEVTVLPNEIARDARALEVYAAFGAPAESILVVRDRISAKLAALVPIAKAEIIKTALFTLPLSLAAPTIGPTPVSSLQKVESPFVMGLRSLSRGDKVGARKAADSIGALHRSSAPGEITMDVVLQEAWLRAESGDSVGAARFLENSLNGLSRSPPNLVARSMLAASLVRAIILRSRLAAALHDSSSFKKWSTVAESLWRNGDPAMKRLLRDSGVTH